MTLHSLFNHFIDKLVVPFAGTSVIVGLFIVSLISAVSLLAIFKKLSNQEKIKFHKNKVFGHFLEIALYRDDFRRTVINQIGILKHNALYLRFFGVPILLLSAPMILVCIQLEYRLGYQPLNEDESFIIQAQLDQSFAEDKNLNNAIIETSDGILVETKQLHDKQSGRLYWRARLAKASSTDFIRISLPTTGTSVTKIVATTRSQPKRFTAEKRKIKSFSDILYSGEDAIPQDSALQAIRVSYQPAEYPFFAWNLSAIVYYIILSILLGFCIKPFMKVNI